MNVVLLTCGENGHVPWPDDDLFGRVGNYQLASQPGIDLHRVGVGVEIGTSTGLDLAMPDTYRRGS